MDNANRRSFDRIDTQLEVDVTSAGGLEFACMTQDISYHGLFLATDQQLPEGEGVDITVWLDARDSGIGLRIQGVVMRGTSEGFGVQVNEVAHSAFEHLRQLILFNSPDPDVADLQIMRDLGLNESA